MHRMRRGLFEIAEKVPNCVILNVTKWNEESLKYCKYGILRYAQNDILR